MSRQVKAAARLDRRVVVKAILDQRGEALVVTGLGSSAWDCAAAGDHPGTFYMWGGMGGAAMVGLGLALAQPTRRVLVVTGDGEMLMGLGSLATIGVEAPGNLTIAVIDNQHYGETGMQASHTGRGVDLVGIARATSFRSCTAIQTRAELEAWIPHGYADAGPVFASIRVGVEPVPLVLPPRDGTYLKHRFREHVLGAKAHR